MKIWILTESYNSYDQYGDYFVAAFGQKPTIQEIQSVAQVTEEGAEWIIGGGGRQEYEHRWYNLIEVDAGAPPMTLLGEVRKGEVIWFGINPHGWKDGTKFYAEPKEKK